MNRRHFLALTGMATLHQFSACTPTTPKGKLSVQLYTIRDQMAADPKSALSKLAAIGFKHVETAFWPKGMTLDQAAGLLKENGLSVSSAHIEMPIGDQQKIFLDTAKAFQCRDMIWHGWPEDKRYSTLEGTRELISIYNQAGKFAKDNGLRFGLHNHWWEFRNKVDGKYVYEWLHQELDPSIFFEIDTYWVKVAGHDPAKIVSQLKNRVRFMHIKDGPAHWHPNLADDNPEPMTAVGKGTQAFPDIIKAAPNTEWLVVEMDKVATDVFEALKESVNYLTHQQLVRL
jgi:sugar phosphate isomerase/epimerase